jgi:hypothetical protein
MADAPDSKSGGGNPVRVQVPPPAPMNQALPRSPLQSVLILLDARFWPLTNGTWLTTKIACDNLHRKKVKRVGCVYVFTNDSAR